LLADVGTDFPKPGEIKRLIDAAKRPRQRALLLTAVIFRSSRQNQRNDKGPPSLQARTNHRRENTLQVRIRQPDRPQSGNHLDRHGV
jgi:hypothetical protein